MKKIKNIDTVQHTWVGQIFEPNSLHEIPTTEYLLWANDDTLLSDIAAGKAQVNNGEDDIIGVANQINFLKDIVVQPVMDTDGVLIQRSKVTSTGWVYHLHCFQFTTAKLNSVLSKKEDGSDYNFVSLKFYKLDNGSEVEITGEDLNQTFLDANCIKTIVDWEPPYDYDIIGGTLKQKTLPPESIHIWVMGVPDVPAAYGGSKVFVSAVDLSFMGTDQGLRIDGRVGKFMAYSATNHTNKFRLTLRHVAGRKHEAAMHFEIFKV